MSVNEVLSLVDEYHKWLRDKSSLREVEGNIYEITTPFLDRHNDYIQIYVRKTGGNFLLSDEGETLDDLRLSGVEISTPKRRELLDIAVRGFGIKCNNERLEVETNKRDFSIKKHSLIQSILAVNDIFYTQSTFVRSFFKEDVTNWLVESDVRFTADINLYGKSGYSFYFDYIIPKSKLEPERIIKLINNPTAAAIKNAAFSWLDTRESRPDGTKAIALLNDSNAISKNSDDALRSYDMIPARWSQRTQLIPQLVA